MSTKNGKLFSLSVLSAAIFAGLFIYGCESRNDLADAKPPVPNEPSAPEYDGSGAIVVSLADQEAELKQQSMAENRRATADLVLAAPLARQSYAMEGAIEAIPQPLPENRNDFEEFDANPIKLVAQEPVSTFSSDVDTASYSFVRRNLNNGILPSKSAVRLEEMVNYFDYHYPAPESAEKPFLASTFVHDSPWAKDRKLLHIGIQGFEATDVKQPDSNLVFLLDVSGSMDAPDKLPLVKQSMSLLLDTLKPSDTVSIVVYAGAAGQVLAPTRVKEKATILEALNNLSAGGSTAGGQGLQLAYSLAEQNFNKDGVNRIILATDGDFNVGINDRKELQSFVERKRDSGIYLSVMGFGDGNYHDHLMQSLAQNGNGVATYIDTLSEAQKVLVHEATSSLFPIANDLKIQVEFNPKVVSEYRLLGYETRELAREDFNNDKVDAGDIGAGHSVTAIYELVLNGSENSFVEPLRYGQPSKTDASDKSGELAFLKMRYKLPGESESVLFEQPILLDEKHNASIQREANFAAAVAGFAQMLKDGKYIGNWDKQAVLELALNNRGDDEFGYRSEFVQLVRKSELAKEMM